MAINRLKIDILEVLSKGKKYISLSDIAGRLEKHRIDIRTLQREMKELIESHRVSVSGAASTTEYILEEIQRFYQKYEYLYVFKGDEIVGLFFKLKDHFRFYYTTEFLIDPSSRPLPTIALDIKPFDFADIPAIFEENIPEGINREILETTSKTADEFEILLKLEDNIGDLSFSKTPELLGQKEDKAIGYLSVLDEMLGTHSKINVLENFSIEIEDEHLFPEGYDLSKLEMKKSHGISGFQYKKLVNIDFEKRIITSDDVAHAYILKPYSKAKADHTNAYYFPHMAINEHLFMSFAKHELGFKVPYSAIVKRDSDKEFHYIVKRFDRLGTKRFAKSTFAVFLGLRSENKYDTSSENMFKRIVKELISPVERMALLKHYAYSVIIKHEDMHTKNLSLIYDGDIVVFAPLYDIACTGFMDGVKGYDSHLPINGKQNNIRINDFRPLCKIMNIDFKKFKAEAQKIALIYKERLPEYIKTIDTLGEIPYYKRKLVRKAGGDSYWKADKENLNFSDVLTQFHQTRVKELETLGWLV